MKKRKRHWYIVRTRGKRDILGLISAFSPLHLKRQCGFLYNKNVVIREAKRWHIVRVFSGALVFYDYKQKRRLAPEDVNAFVPNEFHTLMDGEKILVKILS